MWKDGPDKIAIFSRRGSRKEANNNKWIKINEQKNDEKERCEQIEGDLGLLFPRFSQEIDRFVDAVSNTEKNGDQDGNPPDIPNFIEKFATALEGEIAKCDYSGRNGKWSSNFNEDSVKLPEATGTIVMLTNALESCTSKNAKYASLINRTSNLIQQAMLVLEEEFRSLMEDYLGHDDGNLCAAVAAPELKKKQSSLKSKSLDELDRYFIHEPDILGNGSEENFPAYPPEIVSRLNVIAKALISGGYETECCQAYSITRRNWFEENLAKAGYQKISIEDVQKMNWEILDGEIATWIKASKLCITSYFSGEKNLCDAVFTDHPSISWKLFGNLTRGIVIQLLNFAEAVAMTKRSVERLFKFLDIYETLRDLAQSMDTLFQGGESPPELKSETASASSSIGKAAVSIFSDLENLIKNDSSKTPIPGGAVHPLTRYVMNYLRYACEYKVSLEQVFRECQNLDSQAIHGSDDEMETKHHDKTEENCSSSSLFAVQLSNVMDLLESNIDAKSTLYKDPSLSYIFLMNNGRYIMQKIKGFADVHNLFEDTWRRKRSSNLRQYHKNYQRETWSKVLGCLNDEGLKQGKGRMVKPLLKERFKSFNAMIDDIRKTQSSWVVGDDQLQSELRVSITAVVIPAYRSFLGRFQQYFTLGRQTDKYVKFGSEELETIINELFDGKPSSMTKRKT